MAFNWQTFKTRTLTAAIFVIVMLSGLLINRWTFFALFSVIHFGCWWEYLRLVEKIQRTRLNKYFQLGLIVIGYGLMIGLSNSEFTAGSYGLTKNLSLPVSVAGFVLLIVSIFQKERVPLRSLVISLAGLIYISFSIGLLTNLYKPVVIHIHDSAFITGTLYFYPALIIASLWVNDTMAYIVGSLLGKSQMSRISPKKTWEGTTGGVLFCVLTIFLFTDYVLHSGLASNYFAAIALIVAVTGTFGDLLESKLKRMAGVKDSGHIMPGHGGFLDRFDSLLLATPFVWIFIYALAR